MAIEPAWLDPDELQTRLGVTLTGASLASLKAIMAGVESSIANAIGSSVLANTLDLWLPSSGTDILVIPQRPIALADTFTVQVCSTAYDTTNSTTLEYQTDYEIVGQPSSVWGSGYSGAAMLRRLKSIWMPMWQRLPTRLASSLVPQPGMIRITDITVGWQIGDIPQALFEAGYSESSVRYYQRQRGQNLQSESLNGYSYSLGSASQALQAAMMPLPGIVSDTARALLTPYADMAVNF